MLQTGLHLEVAYLQAPGSPSRAIALDARGRVSWEYNCALIVVQITALVTEYGSLFETILGDFSGFVGTTYTSNYSCPTDGTAGSIMGPSIGQLVATVNVDDSFYSWAGCNCSTQGDERVYAIADNGELFCTSSSYCLHMLR